MAAQAYFYAGSEKTIPKVPVLFFLETVFELENIELQISLALNDLAFHFLLLFLQDVTPTKFPTVLVIKDRSWFEYSGIISLFLVPFSSNICGFFFNWIPLLIRFVID